MDSSICLDIGDDPYVYTPAKLWIDGLLLYIAMSAARDTNKVIQGAYDTRAAVIE